MTEIQYNPEQVTLSTELVFQVLDVLSTADVYILLGSEFEHELPHDFNRGKWIGYELDVAQQATQTYRTLLQELQQQFDNKGDKNVTDE